MYICTQVKVSTQYVCSQYICSHARTHTGANHTFSLLRCISVALHFSYGTVFLLHCISYYTAYHIAENHRSFLQNIVSFIGLCGKRNLQLQYAIECNMGCSAIWYAVYHIALHLYRTMFNSIPFCSASLLCCILYCTASHSALHLIEWCVTALNLYCSASHIALHIMVYCISQCTASHIVMLDCSESLLQCIAHCTAHHIVLHLYCIKETIFGQRDL